MGSGKRGNPLDGTCGITNSNTALWGHWGVPIPNLEHCKYWPDRDGGASGNLGTPPDPTNTFSTAAPTNTFSTAENDCSTCDGECVAIELTLTTDQFGDQTGLEL